MEGEQIVTLIRAEHNPEEYTIAEVLDKTMQGYFTFWNEEARIQEMVLIVGVGDVVMVDLIRKQRTFLNRSVVVQRIESITIEFKV